LIVFYIAAFGVPVPAVDSNQVVYPVDSPTYEALLQLYVSQGKALPSTTGPYSGDELQRMVTKIKLGSLNEQEKEIHAFIMSTLHSDDSEFSFDVQTNIETYIHTDSENFTLPEDWVRSHVDRKPLLDLSLEINPIDFFYGYTALPFTITKYDTSDNETGPVTSQYGEKLFTTNVIFIEDIFDGESRVPYFDYGVPYRAYSSLGGEGWNLQIGRERLSWGPAKSSNFVLSDHLTYHNMGRFTAYGDRFKYTLLTSFFPHPQEYYSKADSENPVPFGYGGYVNIGKMPEHTVNGLSMFLAHRFEWRLFDDKVNLAFTEGIIYMSEDNTLDFRFLSPMMVFHNHCSLWNWITPRSNT
jgi:hypothetical protein